MLKRNYKKLVSVVSAAAMLASLAAPMAMAENTDVEAAPVSETAELTAAGVIAENNFDSVDEGVLMQYTGVKEDPYSELEAIKLHMGVSIISKTPDAGTNASIKDGVGVDGSKALALAYAARGDNGPRIEFDVPDVVDNYMITFDVYPTANQDMMYAADAGATPTAAGLVTEEWNSVEIFVTRKGRIINVNGATLSDTTDMAAPVVLGINKASTGEIYFDNIVVSNLVSLPTPIPTATPVPVAKPQIGDVYDFENYTEGTLINMEANPPVPYTNIVGFDLYVGSRSDPRYNTKAAIVTKDGSKTLQLNYAENADTNRGPRAQLIAPETDGYYKISFSAMVDEGQDLVVCSSTSTHGGSEADLVSGVWNTVDIFMYAGQRIVLANNALVEMATTNSLPVIWGLNAAGVGAVYIDNYSISEVTAEEITTAMAATLNITNAENTVYLNADGTYSVIEGFPIPAETCGAKASWKAFESTDEGATWVDTADFKVGKTAISLSGPAEEKLYKLVGTVDNNGLTASKEFTLKYVKPENVVDTVIERLDITSELYAAEVEKKDDRYIVRGNFAVPISDWVASIEWSSDNGSLIKVGPKGSILMYPKESSTVTLTGAVSYNGETKTKDFILDLSNQYVTTAAIVENELNTVTYSPIGTDGDKVTSITFDGEGTTTLSYDVNLKTTSSTKGIKIEWKTSDADILTADGKINVDNMNENEVTLTKKITYSINDVKVMSDEKDYKINVQFNPDVVKPAAVELAKAYALAVDESATEASVEDSTYYNIAMEMLYDRYVTRFDANCEDNFEDIPTSIDSDFTLPTEGAFGSTITWTSSVTNLKINDEGEVDVTRPTSDKNAKLVATFTSGASVNAGAKEISVTVEGKGGSGGSGGSGKGSSSYGGGNTYLGSLGAAATTPAPTVTTPAQDVTVKGEFTDLDQASWAAVAINYLASKGIVSGRTSTTFDPNANITRAEFAKIIVGAFELPIGGASAGFADVPADAWYAPYVDTCFAAGIITGYDSATFGPNDLVTRQDMAVMVMRAANLKGIIVEAINEKIDFADADEIAAYAVDAVTTLQQGGIINGMTADTFAPTANATRAQAAKILYSLCFE